MSTVLDSAAALFDSTIAIRTLAGTALKSGLVLGISALLIAGIRPSAAVRHLFRTVTLVLVLFLPLIQLVFPPWQADLLPGPWQSRLRSPASTPSQGLEPTPKPRLRVVTVPPRLPEFSTQLQIQPSGQQWNGSPATFSLPEAGEDRFWRSSEIFLREHWAPLLLIVWLGGGLYFSGRLLLSLACVRFAVSRSGEVRSGRWRETFDRISYRLGIGLKARLLMSPKIEVALSVGVIRPAILLPGVAKTWSQERLESILLHELAHVKRWDNLSNVVCQWACALYWFNPLVWWTAEKLKVDRERACDDQVLATGTRATEYVGHLLEVARAVSSRRLWGHLEVSQSSALKDRLVAALNPNQDRRLPDSHMSMAALVVAATMLFPVATFQPWVDVGLPTPSPPVLASLSQAAEGREVWTSRTGPPAFGQDRWQQTSATSDESRGSQTQELSPVSPTQRSDSARDGVPERYVSPTRVINVERIAAGGLAGQITSLNGVQEVRFGQARVEQVRQAVNGNHSSLRFASRSTRQTSESGTLGDLLEELEDFLGPEPQPVLHAVVERIDLGSLGLGESRATDINDHGIVVGQSQVGSGLSHPFLWSRSTGIQDLGNPRGVHTRAMQINDQGQVLCATFDSSLIMGFVWSEDGGLRELGSLDPNSPVTAAKAMNSQGHVVGSSRAPDGTLRAFRWTSEEGLQDLGLSGWSEALAINDAGQIVGHSDGRAFVWDSELGAEFLLDDSVPLSIATALNSVGTVVGYAEFATGIPQAFSWSRENGWVNLGALSLEFPISLALGINDQSHIVGQSLSLDAPGGQRFARGFRWTPESGMEDIGAALVDAPLAINAVGHIIGTYGQTTADKQPLALWLGVDQIHLDADAEAFRESEVVAVNIHGQIVGSTLSGNLVRKAVLWDVRLEPLDQASAADPN